MLGRTDVHMEVRVEVVMDIWTDVFTNTRTNVNTPKCAQHDWNPQWVPTRSRIQFDIHRVGDTLLHVCVGTFLSCGNGFSIKGRPYWGHPSGVELSQSEPELWVNNALTDVRTD